MSEKRKLLFFHIAHRKKLSRKECPGCKQSFSIRYFEQHTKENFESSTRLWKCSKTDFENEPDVQMCEHIDNQSSSDDNLASYRLLCFCFLC